jgi:magnesium-protoporphyrin IX monomethyl ester (oxidative) cyclase
MESAESLLRDQIPVGPQINDSTKKALQDAMLSPRFYTTDFSEIDRTDIDSLRSEWNVLMSEFAADINSDHFQRPAGMDKN